jgi:hypothetical protein
MCLRSTSKRGAFRSLIAAAALTPLLLLAGQAAEAADTGILAPGDAVVTGFPGTVPPASPPAPGVDPMDLTFINPDGASMKVQRLQPSGPPTGQLIASPSVFAATARQVGQVFAITFDNAPIPNIYLGATSAFGIQIVGQDANGDGIPDRLKAGQPGAQFMDGQWGQGGSPGSIYKVDGATGAVSLFATVGANTGPGLGDVVFDRASQQFFVSDLDTGLIYRLDAGGNVLDAFDHGTAARPLRGLPAVADDGQAMDITNPAFNPEDPATWGYTQKERMVYGMAVYGGRLYYAVADGPQVWSVGIRLDGSFAGDARWELDVTGLASADPVTDIAFDGQGRMILAQRGAQHGSYDYSVFAEPKTSSVVRYRREVPDDPATPGTWVPVPEQYAVGFRPDGHNANGGVALGYGYDDKGMIRQDSCGEYLWSTGESLRDDPALAEQLALGGPAVVHGLQGNSVDLVRPANDPPFQSYFADYDDQYDDPADQGHMGDVEILQSCGGIQGYGPYIPPYYPPSGWTPPPSGTFNLAIDKVASPRVCWRGPSGWECNYVVRVSNAGTEVYWGPVSVADWLPTNPAGATVTFAPQPPWNCGPTGPSSYQCDYPPVVLYPGEGIELNVHVSLPNRENLCYLDNVAQILWTPGYGDANPGDDYAFASAEIPNDRCRPTGNRTNLRIDKRPLRDTCPKLGDNWLCPFLVTVTNTGPGLYNGPIQVVDQMSVPNAILYGPQPNPPGWTCSPASGGNYTCDHAPVALNPGQSVKLLIGVSVPGVQQQRAGKCTVQNRARITQAPGGSAMNVNPGDDSASAEAKTPGPNCEPVVLQCPPGYIGTPPNCRPLPPPPRCPPGMIGTPPNCRPIVLQCPPGYVGLPPNCRPIETPKCPPGMIGTPPNCRPIILQCPPGYIGTPPNCRPLPPPKCPPGMFGIPPNCRPIVILCPPGMVGTPPNCRPAKCPPGTFGTPPNCRPIIIKICPPGSVGIYPNCKCPTGMIGTPPNCRPIIKLCPPGTTGTPPNCRPIETPKCPPGTFGTPPNCKPIVIKCPPGQIGTPPNCRPILIKCPPGQVGTPPNCHPPIVPKCPPGTFGTPPNCKPIVIKCPPGQVGTPPNCHPPIVPKCPPGTFGTPPNCKPIVIKCPPGQIGTPPNCKPIVIIEKCPPGMVGRPPNCKPIVLKCPPGQIGTPPNCRPLEIKQPPVLKVPPVLKACPKGSVGKPPNCKCPPGTTGTPGNCQVEIR